MKLFLVYILFLFSFVVSAQASQTDLSTIKNLKLFKTDSIVTKLKNARHTVHSNLGIFSKKHFGSVFSKLTTRQIATDKTNSTSPPSQSPKHTTMQNTTQHVLTEEQEEEPSKNMVSENLYDEEGSIKPIQGDRFIDTFFENYSWFFEKRHTKRKVAFIPSFSKSPNYGSIAGLRLFSYAADKQGYYIGTSFSKLLSKDSFFRWSFDYKDKHETGVQFETQISYSNYPEFFYGHGMETKESDLQTLYPLKIYGKQELLILLDNKSFYSLTGELIYRKEDIELENREEPHSPTEFIIRAKIKVGYDSRDSWRDATTGHYHQASFSCTPNLGEASSFCAGEMDLRSYFTFFEQYVVALRAFAGSTFFGKSAYSLSYRLGGNNILRGFSESRFRGDKIYFLQAEARIPSPILGKYLSGVGFFETGEVAQYKEKAKLKPQWNLGTGLRIAFPPDYRMKLRLDFGFALLDEEKPVRFLVTFFQAF